MVETALLEMVRGIGRIFLNPLFYWIIMISMVISYRRIKKERAQFGTKITPFLMEGKFTLGICLAGSLIISLVAVSIGVVITYEMAIILILVTMMLSMTGSAAFLSASYTIGITFLIALLLPIIDLLPEQAYNVQPAYYIGLTLLAAFLLIIEALLLLSKKAPTYPELSISERGVWVGEHHLKRLAFIPFLCLIPATQSTIHFPLLPYLDLGGESYMLVLFPFIIGYDYKVLADLPQKARKQLGQSILVLGLTVLVLSIASIYLPIFSIAAIVVAIIGKEWVMYTHKKRNKYMPSIFHPLYKGAKVLATIPRTPAARLGITAGETIIKVNGIAVEGSDEFYGALQNSGAFFKLEILNTSGEVRFVNSALYEQDHHELGVVFVDKPYRNKTE